jgi:hypothetical protein
MHAHPRGEGMGDRISPRVGSGADVSIAQGRPTGQYCSAANAANSRQPMVMYRIMVLSHWVVSWISFGLYRYISYCRFVRLKSVCRSGVPLAGRPTSEQPGDASPRPSPVRLMTSARGPIMLSACEDQQYGGWGALEGVWRGERLGECATAA